MSKVTYQNTAFTDLLSSLTWIETDRPYREYIANNPVEVDSIDYSLLICDRGDWLCCLAKKLGAPQTKLNDIEREYNSTTTNFVSKATHEKRLERLSLRAEIFKKHLGDWIIQELKVRLS